MLHHAADAAALREGRRDQRHDQAAGLERGHGDPVRADQHADHHRRGLEHPAGSPTSSTRSTSRPTRRRSSWCRSSTPTRPSSWQQLGPDLRRRDRQQRAGTARHPPRPRRAAAAARSPGRARRRRRRSRGPNAPRFIADERTNAIVVIATKNVLREVERIITLLDYKRKGSGRIHVYRLRNADADEIAQTLSSLATGSPGAGGGGTGGAGSARAPAPRAPRSRAWARARTPRARRWAGSAAGAAARSERRGRARRRRARHRRRADQLADHPGQRRGLRDPGRGDRSARHAPPAGAWSRR